MDSSRAPDSASSTIASAISQEIALRPIGNLPSTRKKNCASLEVLRGAQDDKKMSATGVARSYEAGSLRSSVAVHTGIGSELPAARFVGRRARSVSRLNGR